MNEHTLETNEAKGQTNRGRNATRPSEIPRQGWKDIAIRVKNEIAADNLSIIAAGVAFYAFLSIFPALAAFVSIYGLITDPAELQQHVSSIQTLLPAEAAQLVNDELRRVGASQESHLGWSLVVGMLLAIWSAAKGMKAMFASMNVAYDEEESRGFFKLNAVAVLMTLGAILFVIAFLTLIVGVPAYLASFGMAGIFGSLINYLRWPILAVAGMFALSFLYRYGPSRRKPQWRWISWGATIGTLMWLLGSGLFSFYVANFNN